MKREQSSIFRGVTAVVLLLAVVAAPLNLPAQPTEAREVQSNETELTEPAAAAGETNEPSEPAVEVEQPTTRSRNTGDRVSVGGSLKVESDESVRDAVTVFGKSEVEGTVRHDMVTVLGDSKLDGSVGHDMVTVFGNAEVNGPVDHDLVVVFGSLKLGSNASVDHDCVVVFGRVDKDPSAKLAHSPIVVMPWFSGLADYLRSGPLLGRLLPPTSGLAWIVVGLHLGLYLLIALLLPKPVASCRQQLQVRPLQSFGVGLLVMILMAPLFFVLAVTGVGVVLIPFLGLAETILAVLGKTALFEYFGVQILRRPPTESNNSPLLSFFLGFALVTLLYMVPILGLLTWLVLRPPALGCALLALFATGRKNGNGGSRVSPPVPVQAAASSTASTRETAAFTAPPPVGQSNPKAGEASASQSGPLPPPLNPPTSSTAEVEMMPRAGFWIRTCATALDLVLLAWLFAFADRYFLLIWMTYHVAMWTWKGTSIGGIVCNLKIVRLDGRPLDFSVALVRGMASVFSGAALFLGFFWVGWTAERQSWHDKIAGTVIVRVPKSVSLV